MNKKNIFWLSYFAIALIVTFIKTANDPYHRFFYSFGQSLVWPVIIFPAFGAAVSIIVLLVVLGVVLIFVKSDRS